jgi:hypothetical protein
MASQRRVIAMQYGDHCWLGGLEARPDLNGYRVVLHEWVDDRQRWRCKPHGWAHTDEFIAVRPKNLANEPVPRWALRRNEGVRAKDQTLTPHNSHVSCINHKDFAQCKMEVPPAPTWDAVQHRLMKDALASRAGAASSRESSGQKPTAAPGLSEGIESQLEQLKINLGKQVREYAGEDSDPGSYYAAQLEALMKREGELRKVAVDAGADSGGNVSMEDTLRHMLCQEALLEAQISLFALRDEPALVEKAAAMLHQHFVHLEPARKKWEATGKPELDFWEDSE